MVDLRRWSWWRSQEAHALLHVLRVAHDQLDAVENFAVFVFALVERRKLVAVERGFEVVHGKLFQPSVDQPTALVIENGFRMAENNSPVIEHC